MKNGVPAFTGASSYETTQHMKSELCFCFSRMIRGKTLLVSKTMLISEMFWISDGTFLLYMPKRCGYKAEDQSA